MSRRPLIAGNWKMHMTIDESVLLAREVVQCSKDCGDRDVMIAPAFTALQAVVEAVNGSNVQTGAQNVAWEEQGAYTAEISPLMLQDLGVGMVLIGHSERRHVFGESDELINLRLVGALKSNLTTVLCIGETLDVNEAGLTFNVLEGQVNGGLEGITREQAENVILAYEPVWAIGTGRTASKEQAQEVHAFLRKVLSDMYDEGVGSATRILYGGSVKPDNIDELMTQPDIDGVLVGGASLSADSFRRIVNFE